MKIAGRAGHNENCRGARATLDEVTENRKIFPYSKAYLEKKHNFIDCTPYHNPSTQSVDLNYGINIANQNNVDLFYSVHLNKSTESFEGIIGAEVWVYDRNSAKAIEAATRILDNLKQLGFKNRGIKYMKEENRQLGELMYTNCDALIVECFFLEATKDIEIYNKVGPEAVGFAIASGIDPSIGTTQKKHFVRTGDFLATNGLEINNLNTKYFYDIERLYVNPKGSYVYLETQYLSKEKCNEIVDRLRKDNLYADVVDV